MKKISSLLFSISLSLFLLWSRPVRAGLTVLDNSGTKAVIVVPSRVMEPDHPIAQNLMESPGGLAEGQRRRLRESTKDLGYYLEKITGVPVTIRTETDNNGSGIPIYIGELAEKSFGPVGTKAPFKQGFRYVVTSKGVGLYGESDLASSYAIYELLDRLGCRWFMPGDLGEVIPQMKSITFEETDFSSAPGTIDRENILVGKEYARRNRLGGLPLQFNEIMETFITKEDRALHPEWCAVIGGKPNPVRLKWSSQGVADTLATRIEESFVKYPRLTATLSPEDGSSFDESPEDRKLDTGDIETTMNTVSLTDRLMVLCNRVAKQVLEKYPDTYFGVLAYVQFTRPPTREKVNSHIIPEIAPITYDRSHPITDEKAPHNKELLDVVQGWGKVSPLVSIYFYGYNLAEVSAPCPLIRKWSVDLPIYYKNHGGAWEPETVSNFETNMHALYLGNKLAWNPKLEPAAIIKDINERFYGAAASQMAVYWSYVDDAWTETPEYSGADFGYLIRFTPKVLSEMRKLMDKGVTACRTGVESQRVEMADASLRQFELYMKMLRDCAGGSFANLTTDYARWSTQEVALADKYEAEHAFEQVGWTKPVTLAVNYLETAHGKTYKDAARIQKDCKILTSPLKFKYAADRDNLGEKSGWDKTAFDDSAWPQTNPAIDTWSALGFYDYLGTVWYRTPVNLASIPQGKKVFLWLGGTDGTAEIFVNGKPIVYIDPNKNQTKIFSGYCTPVSFDITSAVHGGTNQVSIRCKRTGVNELGSGGLVGPVMVYAEK